MRIVTGIQTQTVKWIKCKGDVWCSFEHLNLNTVNEHGVYIIWYSDKNLLVPVTVYVGQGDVADRIAEHREEPEFMEYSFKGTLYVTWAKVPQSYRRGVEKFLAGTLSPLVGERHPKNVQSVRVPLPW